MAIVESRYIVRTNAHRKKIADGCVTGTLTDVKFTKIALGDGGKASSGDLKAPNGAVPQLFHKVKELPINRFQKISDFEYTAYLTVDTSVHTDLVGKDINERAIVDAGGVYAVIETFAGFGPLQANKTYEYAIKFTVI